jgi:hypothetical protein
VTFAVIVAPAHALVLTVSHDLPISNPFLVAVDLLAAAPTNAITLSREFRCVIAAGSPVQA